MKDLEDSYHQLKLIANLNVDELFLCDKAYNLYNNTFDEECLQIAIRVMKNRINKDNNGRSNN